jgi:hypothetical protein
VNDLRGVPDADQIWAIDRALELGSRVVKAGRPRGGGIPGPWTIRLIDQTGAEVDWICGAAAGQYALSKIAGD